MLSTKITLPNLTKSIIFAIAATFSMSASAGDVAVEDGSILTGESPELVITDGDAIVDEAEMTEEELAEKEALEKEAELLEGLILPE